LTASLNQISTASGSERDFGSEALVAATLATARGTDPDTQFRRAQGACFQSL